MSNVQTHVNRNEGSFFPMLRELVRRVIIKLHSESNREKKSIDPNATSAAAVMFYAAGFALRRSESSCGIIFMSALIIGIIVEANARDRGDAKLDLIWFDVQVGYFRISKGQLYGLFI